MDSCVQFFEKPKKNYFEYLLFVFNLIIYLQLSYLLFMLPKIWIRVNIIQNCIHSK